MRNKLIWLALGGFAGANEGFLIGSLLPLVASDMGVTVGEAGYIVLGYSLAYGFGTPLLSTVFGALDRRRLLLGAELGVALCMLVIAFAPSLVWLTLARILLALCAGLFTANAIATAAAIAPPEQRGRAIGFVAGGQSLALLVGVPAGAYLAAHYGWQVIYFIVCALALVAAVAIWLRLPRDIKGDRRTIRERLAVLAIPGVPRTLAATMAIMVSGYLTLLYIAPLAVAAVGWGRDLLPVVLLANGIGAFAGANLGGRLADRFTPLRAVLLVTAGHAGAMALLWLAPALPQPLAVATFLLGMGLTGLFGWAYWTAQSSHLAALAGPATPLAVSINMTALNVGVALAAYIGGRIVDSLGGGWLAPVALPFAVLALAIMLAGRPHKAAASTA